MKRTRILGAAGALAAAMAGAWLVACSSNDATTEGGASTVGDGGGADARTTIPSSDAGRVDVDGGAGTGTGSGTGDDAGGVTCHPPSLHPPTAGVGVYCPYSGVDGGRDVSCATGTEQCCETPSDDAGASSCVAAGAACPAAGSTVWQCEDPSNCPSGQVCCSGATLEQDSECGYYRAATGFPGTHCAATCAAGELTICEQQSECTKGTCTPFRAAGNSVGACR